MESGIPLVGPAFQPVKATAGKEPALSLLKGCPTTRRAGMTTAADLQVKIFAGSCTSRRRLSPARRHACGVDLLPLAAAQGPLRSILPPDGDKIHSEKTHVAALRPRCKSAMVEVIDWRLMLIAPCWWWAMGLCSAAMACW